MSAFEGKADMCGALAYVGFGPEADIMHNAAASAYGLIQTVLQAGDD